MSQSKKVDVSEAEIAVHWQEEAYVHPPEKFVAQANSLLRHIVRYWHKADMAAAPTNVRFRGKADVAIRGT
jgi:hypothetical protein